MDRRQATRGGGGEQLERRAASSSTSTTNESRPSSADLDSGVRTHSDSDRLLGAASSQQNNQTAPSAPLARQIGQSSPLRRQQSSIPEDISVTGNGKHSNKLLRDSREELPIRKAASNSRLDRQNKTMKKTTSTDSGRPPSFNSAIKPPNEPLVQHPKVVQLGHIDWQYNNDKEEFHKNPEDGHWESYNESKIAYFMPSPAGERQFPKTRFAHLVLKSIVLFLCALLLLLTLFSAIMASIKLPRALEKFPTTHSFNVTIATG